jgi:hypothetical protein
MKKTRETIRLEAPKKHRAHFVLFAENSPFRPQRVENKRAYSRRPKHVKELFSIN